MQIELILPIVLHPETVRSHIFVVNYFLAKRSGIWDETLV
jgi:hypothetical protein